MRTMLPMLPITALALVLAAPAVQAEERAPLVVADFESSEVMLLRVNATTRCREDCVVRGMPYSAQRVYESVQVLADGNRIVNRSSEQLYRDADGRTRVESDWLGQALVQIQDPVQGMSYRLQPSAKTGLSMAMGAPAPSPRNAPPPSMSPVAGMAAEGLAPALASATVSADGLRSTRPLGTRQMEGETVEGTLQTTTIPAGKAGNTQPIVTTAEVWRSRALKLDLYTRVIDPRSGERVTRLENLRRGTPSPSLFTVPGDYTVREIKRR